MTDRTHWHGCEAAHHDCALAKLDDLIVLAHEVIDECVHEHDEVFLDRRGQDALIALAKYLRSEAEK
jgi:hypothetical protein